MLDFWQMLITPPQQRFCLCCLITRFLLKKHVFRDWESNELLDTETQTMLCEVTDLWLLYFGLRSKADIRQKKYNLTYIYLTRVIYIEDHCKLIYFNRFIHLILLDTINIQSVLLYAIACSIPRFEPRPDYYVAF